MVDSKEWNSKEYHELVALYILKYFFSSKINNFEKGESPDWQNTTDDIGLEVTTAITPEEGRRHAFEQRIFEKKKTYQQVCEIDKNEFGGTYSKSIKHSNGGEIYSVVSVRHGDGFEHLMTSVNNKLFKLNNNPKFKDFKFNYLYIRDLISVINENMITERILPKIHKLHKYYNKEFDAYFIFNRDSYNFFIIYPQKSAYEKINLDDEQYKKIKKKAKSNLTKYRR